MVTAENEDKSRSVTRNSSFFKQIGDQKVTEYDNEQSSVEDKADDNKQLYLRYPL